MCGIDVMKDESHNKHLPHHRRCPNFEKGLQKLEYHPHWCKFSFFDTFYLAAPQSRSEEIIKVSADSMSE
jgi:hypothetical protein